MSESTDPPTRAIPTPGEMPWVISYLRDDIQNLRQDLRIQIKAGHDRIDETNKRTDETTSESTRPTSESTRPATCWASRSAPSTSAWTPISFG